MFQKDFEKSSKKFRRILSENPGNVQDDSGECLKRFQEMFKNIPGNFQQDFRKYFQF